MYLKTYDKELAQDITSETFLKALDKINTFKNNKESSFKAWIYRIAYNLVIDDYKVAKSKVENIFPRMTIPINKLKSPLRFMIKAFLAASLYSWFLCQNTINK